MTVRATTAVRAPACRGKDEIASEIDSGRRRWTRNAKADQAIVGEVIAYECLSGKAPIPVRPYLFGISD